MADELLEFYASEALMCPRRIYYRLKGYPQRWPINVKIRLEQGVRIHNLLGNILKSASITSLRSTWFLKLRAWALKSTGG